MLSLHRHIRLPFWSEGVGMFAKENKMQHTLPTRNVYLIFALKLTMFIDKCVVDSELKEFRVIN